jgi:Kdo2-lipid IVA lauroyltransferase/acyltransferase
MFKSIRRFVRAQILWVLFLLAGLLPLRLALWLGERLGGLAFLLLRGERAKALRHLAIAFPEASDEMRASIARASFRQLGRSALEVTQLRKIDIRSYVDWPHSEIVALESALAGRTGGVLVFGHIGNWELVGPRMVAEKFGGVAIARDSGDVHLARKIEGFRRRLGLPVVGRGKGSESLRGIYRALKEGKLVALLIDQDTRVESVFVPFFGKLAHTPSAAEDLARLAKGVCVMAFIHRKPEGGHKLHTEIVDGTAPELTARLTARIEAELRAYPVDWVWMHERWKRRPEEA